MHCRVKFIWGRHGRSTTFGLGRIPTEVRSRDRHQTLLLYFSRKPASLVLVHIINPFSIKIKIETQWLKNTLKDQSPFEYLQTNRVCIDGKEKPIYASIISKCLNLNNRGIPTGANWKYSLRDASHVIHVACLIYVTLNLYLGLSL